MTKKISIANQLFAVFLCLLVPFFAVLCLHYQGSQSLLVLEKRFSRVKERLVQQEEKRKANESIRNAHRQAVPDFVERQMEGLRFLQTEINRIEEAFASMSASVNPALSARYHVLVGQANRLIFSEEGFSVMPFFKESSLHMKHPVEIDKDDLYGLLCKIEGVSIAKHEAPKNGPQFIPLLFQLERKKHANGNEVFVLNMRLLKREYH